jgi:hypothetical protein
LIIAIGVRSSSSPPTSSTRSRRGTLTWTAARPTPGAAYIVSNMSSIRRRSSSSTRSTGSETWRRSGSGSVMIGSFDMALT